MDLAKTRPSFTTISATVVDLALEADLDLEMGDMRVVGAEVEELEAEAEAAEVEAEELEVEAEVVEGLPRDYHLN